MMCEWSTDIHYVSPSLEKRDNDIDWNKGEVDDLGGHKVKLLTIEMLWPKQSTALSSTTSCAWDFG